MSTATGYALNLIRRHVEVADAAAPRPPEPLHQLPAVSIRLWPALPLLVLLSQPAGVADELRTFEGFTEPVRSIQVSAKEPGPVTEVLVRRGDRVRRLELLVRLDDLVLQQTRAAVEAEATSTANLDALAIERDTRKRRYQNMIKLHEAGSGSDDELALAKADFEVAEKRIAAAREQQQIAILRLSELDARLGQRQIASPIDGIVVDVKKKPGEFVATEDLHLVTIVQLQSLRAVFFLPTVVASQLKSADVATVTLPLYDRRISASVEYVAPITEPDSGLVRVHLLIPNKKESFRSGIRCLLSRNHPAAEERGPIMTPILKTPAQPPTRRPTVQVRVPPHDVKRKTGTWVATGRSRTTVRAASTSRKIQK